MLFFGKNEIAWSTGRVMGMNALNIVIEGPSAQAKAYPPGHVAGALLDFRSGQVIRSARHVAAFMSCDCVDEAKPCVLCMDIARVALGANPDARVANLVARAGDPDVEAAAISDVGDRGAILLDELAAIGEPASYGFNVQLIVLLHDLASHVAMRFAGTSAAELKTLAARTAAIAAPYRDSIPRDATRLAAAAAIDLDDAMQFLCGLYFDGGVPEPLPCEIYA